MYSLIRAAAVARPLAKSTLGVNNRVLSRFLSNNTSEKVTTRQDDHSLHVNWDQTPSTYSYLWLRDNCQCERCLHPSSRQKLHSSADIPLNIKPSSVNIIGDEAEIKWSQGLRHQTTSEEHVSRYSLDFLRRYQSRETSEKFRFNHIVPKTWNRDEYKLDWVSYNDYMNTDAGLHTVVQRLYNNGIAFLDNVPIDEKACTQVAERIGPIDETFYGRDFNVKNIAKSINIAYTSLYLGFHMDLM